MSEQDALDAAVTVAIFKAEEAEREAARAWHVVAECEKAVAEHPETPDVEREVARRGVVSADKRRDFWRHGFRAPDRLDDLSIKLVMLLCPGFGEGSADFMRAAERARELMDQVLGP